MKLPRRNLLHLAAGAAALPAMSRIAWAQSYPTRPVHWIVGFPHSITSSARPSSESGKVTPSAVAVLTLMISSIFVACWTGRPVLRLLDLEFRGRIVGFGQNGNGFGIGDQFTEDLESF
jgi:hypothetical protein